MDTRIEHHEEFIVRSVPNGRHHAWFFRVGPLRTLLAVAVCFVTLSGFAQLQWRHTHGETNAAPGSRPRSERPRAVALDKAENVFVAASTGKLTLLKLSASGELLWVRHITDIRFAHTTAEFLALDGNGNAYVLGEASTDTGHGIVVVKYDPDGNLIWTATYDYPGGYEEPAAIALDSQANVYVTGLSESHSGFQQFTVAFTVKFNSNGQQLWSAIHQGRHPGYHAGKALTVDAFDNAYVTGYTTASVKDGQGRTVLRSDVLTVKYDPTGRQVWARRYNGTPGLNDWGYAIVVDPLGQAYVAGLSEARGSPQDWITLKYSNTGQLRWAKRRDGGNIEEDAIALARDEQGSIYVSGGGSVIKYSDAGRKVWESFGYRSGAPMWLQLDAQGFLYYAQTDYSPDAGASFRVEQIETQYGERLWTASSRQDPPRSEHAVAMAVAPSGGVVVTGSSYGDENADAATVRFQPPDYRETPRVNIGAADPNAIEGGRGVTALGAFVVWRTGATNEPLVVGFQATGTAKPGLDYLPALQDGFGTVTIPAGSTYALIPIQPVNDRVWERTENVRFTIYRGSDVFGRYLFGPYREAVVRIIDNEW